MTRLGTESVRRAAGRFAANSRLTVTIQGINSARGGPKFVSSRSSSQGAPASPGFGIGDGLLRVIRQQGEIRA
jgi:hypothetical protein